QKPKPPFSWHYTNRQQRTVPLKTPGNHALQLVMSAKTVEEKLGLKLTKAQAMVLLKRRLDVRSEGGTLIQVGVFGKRPEEPEEAMDIANTIADELRAFRIEQHDSPAEMLEMSLRFTPPYFLLGIAAAFVLGLLAGGLVLLRGFLRRGSQARQVKKGVETRDEGK
ncbi:MAG: hypothetical protein ACLQU3_13865, partial [Limisphaerales bacterium]